jgi:hypothetical protein
MKRKIFVSKGYNCAKRLLAQAQEVALEADDEVSSTSEPGAKELLGSRALAVATNDGVDMLPGSQDT